MYKTELHFIVYISGWVEFIRDERPSCTSVCLFSKLCLYPCCYFVMFPFVYPAPVISGERLKKYVFHKILTQMPEGPFCIVYMHTTVQKEDNSPGLTILRWIYEELPNDYKDRLQVVYFIHPGLRSRLLFATLGRFLLSGGLYWKIKYVSRLQYLWQDIKKGQVEIPEFVQQHDDILEHRPLTDYGIEPDHLHLMEVTSSGYSYGRHETAWSMR
ncbi:hypothetical protein ACS0TY_030983 [Phlomoides rotata]